MTKEKYIRTLNHFDVAIKKREQRVHELENAERNTPQKKRAWTLANNVLKRLQKEKESWILQTRICK